MKTIAVDFDGVIHKYRDGWQDGSIYDEANIETIFLGKKPFENVIDDMYQGEIWGKGHMYWRSKAKAEACTKNLKNPAYRIESDTEKLSVKTIYIF